MSVGFEFSSDLVGLRARICTKAQGKNKCTSTLVSDNTFGITGHDLYVHSMGQIEITLILLKTSQLFATQETSCWNGRYFSHVASIWLV